MFVSSTQRSLRLRSSSFAGTADAAQTAGVDAANAASTVLWNAATSGKLADLSYSQLVGGVVDGVTQDKVLMASLSPPSRMAAGVLDLVIKAAMSGTNAASSVGSVLVDASVALAHEVLKEVLSDIAKEVSKDAASVVPVIGAVISILIDILAGIGSASGTGSTSNDINVRRIYCQNQFAPLRGTGPGMQVVPSDYFGDSENGYGELSYPSIGIALMNITETAVNMDAIRALASVRRAVGDHSLDWSASTKLGIPAKVRTLFVALRTALEKTYKRGDGGAALWPLYIDLLRIQFDTGHMTDKMAEYLVIQNTETIWPKRGADETTCYYHEKRGLQSALDLLRGWRQSVKPFYGQFKVDTAASEAAVLKAAQAAVAARVSKAKSIAKSAPASAPIQARVDMITIAASLQKTSGVSKAVPIAAAGGGIAALVAALLFL